MRMLLGIACLTMLWLFCGTSGGAGQAVKESLLPTGCPRDVLGAGDDEVKARAVALRAAVKEVNKLKHPPLKIFVVTDDYVENNVVDKGRAGEPSKDPPLKTWIFAFRTDKDWWSDIVRRDQDAQRKARADDRQKAGSLVIVGLALVLLVGFGYVRLDEYTHRRYTTWLRLAGVGVATSAIAGWWFVFFQAQG